MNLSKLLLPVSVLLGACASREIQAIFDKYDTFGSTGSTGATSTSTSSSTGTSTTGSGTGTGTDSGDGTAVGTSSGVASSTGSDATTATGSQTTGTSVCGDGVIEGDEECDDQNDSPADGCLANCTREWLVFITSEPFTQGDIKGLVGADYQCRHRAAKLFLPSATGRGSAPAPCTPPSASTAPAAPTSSSTASRLHRHRPLGLRRPQLDPLRRLDQYQ